MKQTEIIDLIEEVRALVDAHYVFPDVATEISQVLSAALADGRYGSDEPPIDEKTLALAVTADLQSTNGDKHLRLLYHAEPMLERQHGDDAEEYAAMTRWADRTCGGVASAQRLPGNVGYLDLQPLLFPAAICGEGMSAAMGYVSSCDALIVDLRNCLGGEPTMVVYIYSYLWSHEPVELTGLYERTGNRIKQSWTLPYVAGRRFGATKPVYVLTSATTFSGGEQLGYDLQQHGRATIIGEVTRGGAHAREGFRVHPHLEVTIPVARAVHPITGGNWEGTGVVPDIEVSAARARESAYQLALEHCVKLDGPTAGEARQALVALLSV